CYSSLFTRPLSSVIYTLSLHDALPIFTFIQLLPIHSSENIPTQQAICFRIGIGQYIANVAKNIGAAIGIIDQAVFHSVAEVNSRSEEHTSELQSRENLVCRLLLEKKKP